MSVGEIITFDGPYTTNKYNQFFNPNTCHVCKLPSKNLIPCNKCYMVSYCSKKHQKIHEDTHLVFCRNLARIIRDKSDWNTCHDRRKWVESRMAIIIKIANITIYEHDLEIIIRAKSCFKCYRQINIKPCVICYSANFCDDHQMLFNLEHKDNCKELLLSLNINIACIKNNIMDLCLAFHKDKIKSVTTKMQEVTGATSNQLYRKNKFRSCRPHRNYVTHGVNYHNEYFIMYS
ncbi:uncharacterized protein LOC116850739 [Odontomachus brunneus]|uniref:uncharacterized protein LOC116850739 n=1 Tax=Odontomachus brunneus TaxID=486640 RepID=UPI0013F282BC|nr:uncharacterized protein LOC116850739 [Odontomachus brunneus]